jgi:nucleoside-diphosphate-sugar epimerase
VRVLITGGAGYIGSVLTPMLIDRGDRIRVVDAGWFGLGHVDERAELIEGNILDFDRSWLDGIDAVVHLAGLSNDPMAAFSPALNYMLNATGPALVAEAAKERGIARFVFASTCSVYGMDDSSEAAEERPTKPAFPYAISKLMAERLFACLEDKAFRPIVLRKGTVVGWSPRMRFDLVVNTMVKTAVTEGTIRINDPALWRPLIDVQDACRAYIQALDADLAIAGTFNIAGQNYKIGRLAEQVRDALAEFGVVATLEILNQRDLRSYRVNTAKADQVLHFRAAESVAATVRGIMRNLVDHSLTDFENPRYYNIQRMKQLVAQGAMPWYGGHVERDEKVTARLG